MIVRALVENISRSEALGCEHGLSLALTTRARTVLFDAGASGLFAQNAQKLGVDLRAVDLMVLSHGHYDHGGGIPAFLSLNKTAKLYVRQGAFDPRFAREPDGASRDIGLDPALADEPRVVLTPERHMIGEGMELFSGVEGSWPLPPGNAELFAMEDGRPVPDRFGHEQNLAVREDGMLALFCGCAHRGVLNILGRFKALYGRMPDHVIGGLHLYRTPLDAQGEGSLREIARRLLDTGARFHTCHCTGAAQYGVLKSVMGERIDYLETGKGLAL